MFPLMSIYVAHVIQLLDQNPNVSVISYLIYLPLFLSLCTAQELLPSHSSLLPPTRRSFLRLTPTYKVITHVLGISINGTMPQAVIDPLGQSEVCYQTIALPPSHHGWITLCSKVWPTFSSKLLRQNLMVKFNGKIFGVKLYLPEFCSPMKFSL